MSLRSLSLFSGLMGLVFFTSVATPTSWLMMVISMIIFINLGSKKYTFLSFVFYFIITLPKDVQYFLLNYEFIKTIAVDKFTEICSSPEFVADYGCSSRFGTLFIQYFFPIYSVIWFIAGFALSFLVAYAMARWSRRKSLKALRSQLRHLSRYLSK